MILNPADAAFENPHPGEQEDDAVAAVCKASKYAARHWNQRHSMPLSFRISLSSASSDTALGSASGRATDPCSLLHIVDTTDSKPVRWSSILLTRKRRSSIQTSDLKT